MRASLTKPGKQLFKSIFLPIRFLSGSTARTDKFLESQAHSHCSQLGPPSHVAPPLGRGVACCNGRCEGLVTRSQESPRMLRVFWQGGHLTQQKRSIFHP